LALNAFAPWKQVYDDDFKKTACLATVSRILILFRIPAEVERLQVTGHGLLGRPQSKKPDGKPPGRARPFDSNQEDPSQRRCLTQSPEPISGWLSAADAETGKNKQGTLCPATAIWMD
jgi:hypothetical protein